MEVCLEDILLEDGKLRIGGQGGDHQRIDFDRRKLLAARKQILGKGSAAGTDFDDVVFVARGRNRAGDLVQNGLAAEEMLAVGARQSGVRP
jgi:hypothetical protein